MDGQGSEKSQIVKFGRRQQLQLLFVVITAFCVSLFAIRFVNTKSNDPKMKLNKKSVALTVGTSQKLKVRNLPNTAKATWKSSKKSVASVSKKGRVKAKKKGKATITCRITYGRKTRKQGS